uniref:Eukaryotic translation initiation factor 4E binding protein 1 n=1 Tax=Scophthalmus maximus TaxID=52904 RepID=A0A8D3C920_SCOMX
HTTSSSPREIPAVRRVAIHDAAHMPLDYSTTPGGTLFSTTPGGTRIIYDRKFLLQCRTSPLARTPPNLPDIPGVTRPLKLNNSTDTDAQFNSFMSCVPAVASVPESTWDASVKCLWTIGSSTLCL